MQKIQLVAGAGS